MSRLPSAKGAARVAERSAERSGRERHPEPAKPRRQLWRERAALLARERRPEPVPASEPLLQFLYSAPIGMVQTDAAGRVELMTPVAAQLLLAIDPNATLENLFTALDGPFPELKGRAAAAGLVACGSIFGPTRRCVRIGAGAESSRSERWVSLSVLKFDARHLLAHLVDVTPAVLEEAAAARESRRAITGLSVQLDHAAELAGLGMCFEDLVTGHIEGSPRLVAMLGMEGAHHRCDLDTLIGAIHPDDRAAFLEGRAAALSGNPGPIREFRFQRADGGAGHFIGRQFAEVDDAGVPCIMTSFFLDISELRAADRARRTVAEHLLLATQAAGLGSFRVSRSSGDLHFDAQSRRLLGDEDPDGPQPENLIDAALGLGGASRLRHWLVELPQGGAAGSIDLEVRRPGADSVWLVARGRNQADLQSRSCVKGVIWDVTQHRVAKQALEARRIADESNRAKSLFLARMGHELRTPLNGILGLCNVLKRQRDDADPAARQRWLRLIEESGHHLLTLINDLLDRSRAEIGELKLFLEAVNLPRAIETVRNEQLESARLRGIRVTENWPANSAVWVQADKTRLRQVLSNLLSNAIKYNRREGSVVLECERCDAGCLLRVIDSGVGIGVEQQQALFEPFNRLGQEGGEVEGIGLGLSITRQLVEAMGGRIACSSELGVGSTFTVELPAGTPAAAPTTFDR